MTPWKKIQNQKAFSIIEVMTSVFILSSAMVGVMSLAQVNMQNQYVNKNAVVASMLAQEGLELVRKIRDENWRNGAIGQENDDWKIGDGTNPMKDNVVQDGTYTVGYDDYLSPAPNSINEADCRLYIDTSGPYYTHDAVGNEPTPFFRLIEVDDITDVTDPLNPINYLRVTSRVRFYKPGGDFYDYVASTLLFNWL